MIKLLKYRNKQGELVPINFYKVDEVVVTQETGDSESLVMSQKAVTDELNKKVSVDDLKTNTEELDERITNLENQGVDELIHKGEGDGGVILGNVRDDRAEMQGADYADLASGSDSVSEGHYTQAIGNCSHAEGSRTRAEGYCSHSEGEDTQANGEACHAEGWHTIADKACSHAEGYNTFAGSYCHVEGMYTRADSDICCHAEGYRNICTSTGDKSELTLHVVGNGNDDPLSRTAHNAHEIKWDGTHYIPDIYAEGKYYEKPMINLQEKLKQLEDDKADDSEVFKYLHIFGNEGDVDDDIVASKHTGTLRFSFNEGFIVDQTALSDWGAVDVSVNIKYIATRSYVDEKISFLINEEGQLEDSFDTLKEVDTWIKNHESEAADIISDINSINTTLTNIDEYITPSIGCTLNQEHIDLTFHAKNLEGGDRTFAKSISAATQGHAGVMTKSDKIKLDSLNIKSDEVEETYTIDEQSKSVKLSEYEGGKVVYPITLSKNVYNEDGSTLEHTIANLPNIYGEEVVELPEVNNEKISRDELSKDLFIKLWNRACIDHDGKSDGRYNEDTGFFELNGITDITFEQAIDIYNTVGISKGFVTSNNCIGFYSNNNIRTHLPLFGWNHLGGPILWHSVFMDCKKIEVVDLKNLIWATDITTMFRFCSSLHTVKGFKINPNTIACTGTFWGCTNLQNVELSGLRYNFSFKDSPKLTIESLTFIVTNAINTQPITIEVHADVYAKLVDEDNAEWSALNELAIEKQISFITV